MMMASLEEKIIMEDKHMEEIRTTVSFNDFKNVFKIFEGYPFFEKWSEEDLKEEYEYYFEKGGFILGYFIHNECVSILALYPYVKGKHPVRYNERQKVMYLSDIATLESYRNQGIGTQMLQKSLEISKKMGYDYMYLRTNTEDISMSAGIAKKVGFVKIPDASQYVEMIRSDGKVHKDLRIFLEKKL